MKTSWLVALTCAALATLSAAAQNTTGGAGAPAVAEKGKMLVASNGSRLGIVYRVGPDGSAQIIIDGKLVSVPASTLSNVGGKLTTSLSKSEVLALP
ncbi:MAG TPA: hypothetical protein VK437_05480 [Steroidobacteraceae bacterium]|nr:hypothetical protein [Steroidobacteraceae bacterium]